MKNSDLVNLLYRAAAWVWAECDESSPYHLAEAEKLRQDLLAAAKELEDEQ